MPSNEVSFLDRTLTFLATGLGVGYVRWAPGTWGTLWGLPLAWAIAHLPGWGWQISAVGVLLLTGVPICGRAARRLGIKDPGCVVWDELSSVPVVFLGLGPQSMRRPEILLLGFFVFRFFDIIKLPPCRRLEGLPAGWGIMMDDVVAGLYGLLSMVALRWWFPWLGDTL